MDSEPKEPSDLFLETRSLRRLARGLLFDPARADDVVQEAWLAELRGARRPSWPRGAWLLGAVRRLARGANRDEERRRRRESQAAGDLRPSAVDSAARVEVMRSVVDAVGALEEPYREAILLRYFDGLPPRAIAKRLGVPVETVRTRVKRGLERLRVRLDGRHGGARGSFLAALLPVAGDMPWPLALGFSPGSASLVPWSGALAMSKAAALAAAAVAAVLLAVQAYRARDAAPERPAGPETTAVLEARPLAQEPPAGGRLVGAEGASERTPAAPPAEAQGGAWIVRGRLALGYRAPCPGGRVRAELLEGRAGEGQGGRAVLRAAVLTADELGEFSWALPAPEGAVTVVVTADRADSFNASDSGFVPAGMDAPQTLQPRAYPFDSVLVGRVVDARGSAVAGAEVVTLHADGRTDRDGRFALRASSLEQHVRGRVLAAGCAETDFSVRPLAAGAIDAGLIAVQAGLRVVGRVVDEAGAPVEGATVSTSWRGFGLDLRSPAAQTDAQGAFELGQLRPRDRDGSLCASKPGYARAELALGEAPADGAPAEVELVLAQGGTVRGRVMRADGSAVRGARVCVGYHPDATPRLDAYSGDDGRFEVAQAPSGPQKLWAIASGLQTAQLAIDVPERGGVLDGLALELEEGGWLSGRVLDENGAGMPWVWIYAQDGPFIQDSYVPSTASDRDGRFRFAGLPGGTLTVGFLAEGYARHEVPLAELDRELVVHMRRAGRLAGRVLDAATGRPVETFTIRFVPAELPAGGQGIEGYWVKWSDPGQSFTGTGGYWNADSEDFSAGRWIGIEATAPGYGPTQVPGLQSETDPDPDAHVILLSTASRVGGQVLAAATGLPLSGAVVSRITGVHPQVAESRWSAHTDAGGFFELVVPAGTMSLAVEHAQCNLFVDGPFDVPLGGSVLGRRILAERGRTLAGVLLAPGGEPLAGETVELRALETAGGGRKRELEATTDAAGAFAFEDLSLGLYHLSWIEVRGELRCQRITRLVELEHAQGPHDVRLQAPGAAVLHGTLRYAGELPELLQVRIALQHDPEAKMAQNGVGGWSGRAFGAIAERGSFRVEGLPPGLYTVGVWVPSDPSVRIAGWAGVEVPAAGSAEVEVEIEEQRR